MALSKLPPQARLKLPGFTTTQDFELGLCAMQSRLWEETRHSQPFEPRVPGLKSEIVPPSELHGYGQSWSILLGIWRLTMEHWRTSNPSFPSYPSRNETYVSIMLLYHNSLLRVSADLVLIRRLVKMLEQKRYSAQLVRRYESQVQQWTESNSAKDALWHAAQIKEIYSRQIPDLRADRKIISPVATHCLVQAALVCWAFSRSSLTCEPYVHLSLTPADIMVETSKESENNTLELCLVDKYSEQYERWLQTGGVPFIDGVRVCACNMPTLCKKYQSLLEDTAHSWIDSQIYMDQFSKIQRLH